METTHIAYVGLGSNIGDGRTTLQSAWQEIGKNLQVTIQKLSSPYLSAPVDMKSDNWFTNAVGQLETTLQGVDLLDHLMEIENQFGRRRNAAIKGYIDRSLDLDIIYFDKVVLHSDKLILPHPCLADRLFVLEPLAEIAPDFIDPVDGLTMLAKKDILHSKMAKGDAALQEISRSEWSCNESH